MEKLFLLDAYALIYRAYYAFIRSPRINSKGLNTSAIMGFVNTLEEVLKKENPDYIGVAFDPGGPTFRHEIYPAYKAQRESTPEDIKRAVPIIKEIIAAYRIPILEVIGYEADDVIGTLSAQARHTDVFTYMMTPDKDYGQLVAENVSIYRPGKGPIAFEILGPAEINEKYGIQRPEQVIDLLGLMGDASDNVPGCPGVGEKTAINLIKQFDNIDNLINSVEEVKGAIRKKIEENTEQIRLSKYLVTIKTDAPIQLDLEKLKREEPDKEALRKIFEELEFHSLIKRVLKEDPQPVKKVNNEPTFFDLFQPESQEEDKKTILTKLEDLNYKYELIEKEEEIEKKRDFLLTNKEFCLDTETTGIDPISVELVGISFSTSENEAFYISVPQKKEEAQRIVNILKPVLENPDIRKIGQNIKYDLLVLKNYGVQLAGPLFDTMIAHYVLQPELRHNMDYLAEIYLNYQTIHIDELIGPKGKNQKNMRDLSPLQVYKYACEDADVTLKLKKKLEAELSLSTAHDLFYNIEMPLLPVLAYMEYNGVCIDTEALAETSRHFTERMNILEQEVYDLAGESFNLSSPKQVGEILFDKLKINDKARKTKKGQYITSEEVLETLRSKHPIVEKILHHRGLKKLLSTYIDSLPLLINPETGHIHTSFNQTVTATGRLSSSNPNLQNIPIRGEDGKEIRKAFIPEPGCEFFSADYSQIELRIMAHLSGDTHMIEAFRKNEDIHASTAAKVYHKNIEEVTKEERGKAKTANFGIIYGISVYGLAERMNVPRAEAKELIENYFKTYPGIKAYMDKSIETAREKGYIETIFRRRRYLPDISSNNAIVRGYAERNAINAPIQGSSADIIKVAMIRIYDRFRKDEIRSKMILQVHDELNFSVYPEEKEKVQHIVIEEMEKAFIMQVPLQVDCGWGKNWLEAH